jgi:hypothetical protein
MLLRTSRSVNSPPKAAEEQLLRRPVSVSIETIRDFEFDFVEFSVNVPGYIKLIFEALIRLVSHYEC